LTLSNLLV